MLTAETLLNDCGQWVALVWEHDSEGGKSLVDIIEPLNNTELGALDLAHALHPVES